MKELMNLNITDKLKEILFDLDNMYEYGFGHLMDKKVTTESLESFILE